MNGIRGLVITQVSVNTVKNDDQVLAYASVVFNDSAVVKNIRMIHRQDGSVGMHMPSIKTSTGFFKDLFHPITQECREYIYRSIMAKLNLYQNGSQRTAQNAGTEPIVQTR